MEIHKGVTRIVFIFENIVIKIPNFTHSWYHFIKGLLCNMNEHKTWTSHSRKDLLCPVRWIFPGGWLIIMVKCDPVSCEDYHNMDFSDFIYAELHEDMTPYNFGKLNGNIVKIDYGD